MKEDSAKNPSTMAIRRRNTAIVVALLGVVLTMGLLAFNSLPLYQLFSRLTGYGGTTQVAKTAPRQVDGRLVTVRFDVNVAADMPWKFTTPPPVQVRLGEEATVSYTAWNIGKEPILGTATYNVTPFKAGPYFDNIRCFCFTDHVLMPGEQKQLSVTFFVDPKMVADPTLNDVDTITLAFTYFDISNSFFKARSATRDPRSGITR